MASLRLTGLGGLSSEVIRALRTSQSFTTHGALSATDNFYDMPCGRLPEKTARMFREAVNSSLIEYAVYSYGTPILWVMYEGTVISPDHSYSPTTNKHQVWVRNEFEVSISRFRLSWWEDGIQRSECFYTRDEAENRRHLLLFNKVYGAEVETCSSVETDG